jgi:peptidoglycan-N-acetylglucosamine deacetylase
VNPWMLTAPAALAAAGFTIYYGAVDPGSQLFGRTVRHTSSPRRLAITFDDGPNPTITPKFLEFLDRQQVRATFFLIGRYVRECPDLAREVVARGHVVGNHTQTHPNLFWLTPAKIRDELRQCQDSITAACGVTAKWFRPPFGFRNPAVVPTARDLGLQAVMWSLIPKDWRAESSEWLIDRMHPIGDRARRSAGQSSGADALGDILCLHDGSHRAQNTDRSRTLAALEYCVPRWRDLGLEFVTIENAVRTAG